MKDVTTWVLPPMSVIISPRHSQEALVPELPGAGGYGFRELVRKIQGPSEVKPKTLL